MFTCDLGLTGPTCGQRVLTTVWVALISASLSILVIPSNSLASEKTITIPPNIKTLLEAKCWSCHDGETMKGKVRLDNLEQLELQPRLELLNKVQEQVYINEMPPKKKLQLGESGELLNWVSNALKAHNASTLEQKLQFFKYGNYVNHDKLFSGEIQEESYSPARLWRRSPDQFDNAKMYVFGDPKTMRDNNAIKQPFQKGEGEGFSDYAALMYADSATFDTLYRNAEYVIDQTLLMAFIEMDYAAQGKTMEDWKADRAKVIEAQQANLAEMAKNGQKTRYVNALYSKLNSRYNFKTPEIYREIILGKGVPAQDKMEQAIQFHFNRVIQQDPTAEDLAKYTSLMREGINQSGPYFGLRNALIAVMVSPKFIYRSELGLGKATADGRSMLSPVELAYAISFALTDTTPDPKLLEAVKTGCLLTREDAEREVTRLLNDHMIEKPRIMRFFQEFFDYARAPEVFKDDLRIFKGYTTSKIARDYVNDTDILIEHILKKDKNVFKELLTTEKYFVSHSGDNEQVRKEVDAYKKLYAYFKDKNWRNYAKESKKHEDPSKQDLAFAQSLHPDFKKLDGDGICGKMKFLEPYEKKGLTAFNFSFKRTTEAHLDGLVAYNLDVKDWNYPVEQPFALSPGKRAGILSHPSWLIAHSLNKTTDPVRRGKWIRERLLAGTIPDVPITVDATVPEDPKKSLRQRYSVCEAEYCWKCHVRMNPLGYSFEIFDDFGRWRNRENLEDLPKEGKNYQTLPIDSKGYLEGTGDKALDGEVTDAVDLVKRLGDSRRVQQSIIRHAFRYWMGRNEMLTDSKTLIRAEKAYMDNGGSFKAMLVSLLTSDSFIYRKH